LMFAPGELADNTHMTDALDLPTTRSGMKVVTARRWRLGRRARASTEFRGSVGKRVAATTDEMLARVPLFAGLSKGDLRKVASLATRLDRPAGSELARQGGTGGELILILGGIVDVVVDDEVVATVGPRDFCDAIVLLQGRGHSTAVVARTGVAIAVVSRREFFVLISDFPEIEAQLRAATAPVAPHRIAKEPCRAAS
jgi:hypothetical protein